MKNGIISTVVIGVAAASSLGGHSQERHLPAGVEKVCAIDFDRDTRRPARVEDGALGCLDEVSRRLRDDPTRKLVLVGSADPVKDHAEDQRGETRMQEDAAGTDLRFGDIAMYRAINTKDYLVRWNHVAAGRIIPTTNEWRSAQQVQLFLVPGDADFLNNYLGTTKTNEKVCTVKPCPDPREERLTPQPRNQIHKREKQ